MHSNIHHVPVKFYKIIYQCCSKYRFKDTKVLYHFTIRIKRDKLIKLCVWFATLTYLFAPLSWCQSIGKFKYFTIEVVAYFFVESKEHGKNLLSHFNLTFLLWAPILLFVLLLTFWHFRRATFLIYILNLLGFHFVLIVRLINWY